MIRLSFLFILLSSSQYTAAQQDRISTILNSSIRIPLYEPTASKATHTVTIPCSYGQADLQLPGSAPDFLNTQVLYIDLVYTDHPTQNDLRTLNTRRLTALFHHYPALADPAITWRVLRQTNGAGKEDAILLFHGFVIHYRAPQTKAIMAADIEALKTLLKPLPTVDPKKRRGFVSADTTHLREQYEIEEYTHVQKLPVPDALRYLGIDEREKYLYKGYDSLFVYEKPLDDSSTAKTTLRPPEDSTVLKVLNRMPWQQMLVVADVTASMYPYIGQLMFWLRLHEDDRRIHQFVFFNDGDQKDEDDKVLGRAGGIYQTGSSVYDVVEKLVYTTMSNGSGGAIPENNIEALTAGLSSCSSCNDVVMIADNWSPVRDLALLSNIRRPVHIILCGVKDIIQPDYLTIAWRTGGSVHFGEQDINDFTRYKEGDSINLLEQDYTIRKGRFVKK